MTTSEWISIAAVATAVALPLLIARWERRDRHAEIALLRQEVEGQAAERAGRARAELAAEPGGISGGDRADAHEFTIVNAGPATARDVRVWAENEGEPITAVQSVGSVLLHGERKPVTVHVPIRFSRRKEQVTDSVLVASWRDDTGPRQEVMLTLRRHG